MDLDHPDLADLSQRLQRRLDAVLEAEHRAAAVAARRTSTLRDRLLEVEDRATPVVVWTVGGRRFEGGLLMAGGDHVAVVTASGTTLIATSFIEAVEAT
jgi:hypothetical protein